MSNLQLNKQLAIELGYNLSVFATRRPYAREVFKVYDIELLPNSALDTLVGELYEWKGQNWRSLEKNLVGFISKDTTQLERLVVELKNIPKLEAQVPDFEFSKKEIIDLDFKLPFLFNLGFSGNFKNAKDISIKVDSITRSRITNTEKPGIEIHNLLSEFKLNKTKQYRRNIKSNHIANTLFYAKSVEIQLTKEPSVDIGITFDAENTIVDVGLNTDTTKVYKLSYKNNELCPFGAGMVKGKFF